MIKGIPVCCELLTDLLSAGKSKGSFCHFIVVSDADDSSPANHITSRSRNAKMNSAEAKMRLRLPQDWFKTDLTDANVADSFNMFMT